MLEELHSKFVEAINFNHLYYYSVKLYIKTYIALDKTDPLPDILLTRQLLSIRSLNKQKKEQLCLFFQMLSLAKKFKIYSWLFIYPEHLKDSSVLKENTETIYPGQQSIRKSGHKASRGVLSTQIYSPDRRKGLKKCHVFVPRRRPSSSLSSTANNPLKLYNRGRTREKQIAANNSL